MTNTLAYNRSKIKKSFMVQIQRKNGMELVKKGKKMFLNFFHLLMIKNLFGKRER